MSSILADAARSEPDGQEEGAASIRVNTTVSAAPHRAMQHCEFAALGSACEALRLLGCVDRRYATPVSPSRIAPLWSRPRGAEASWTRSEGHPLLRLGGAARGLQPHARAAQGQGIDRSNDCPRP